MNRGFMEMTSIVRMDQAAVPSVVSRPAICPIPFDVDQFLRQLSQLMRAAYANDPVILAMASGL